MTKAKFKIGDIFSATLDHKRKRYFQYVANDTAQLNSDVIRVFKRTYPLNETPNLKSVVNDDVEFYAHVVLEFGIKFKYWEKVGNVPEVGKVEVFFRNSSDYGNPQVKVSNNWWIWKISEPHKSVGKLEGEYQKAEIGVVVTPQDILDRMRTGKYDFVYPQYQ